MKLSKKHILFSVVLVIIVFAFVVMVQAYYSGNNNSGCGCIPPQNLSTDGEALVNEEMAAKLWNQNVSLGEYLENVFPDYFNNLTEECKEQYYNQSMNWPDLHPDLHR
ncbi:hypothetical protein J2741_000273 [Methanolinea mesophila]|uniref:hypothetical protein n=1 Tax=Methanolinea mesophila TaxID=547055 RepID=UPI001AE46150|nr:hypothetical protein [Methanolinea mesophila]MBP1927726.1 hypothetical protein [Methanolinea mesophila]